MEERVVLVGRKAGSFTGVVDVISFDLDAVLMETGQGMLQVKGKNLHVSRLNLEKGEVDLDGEICALDYSALGKKAGGSEGFWAKLLK